ncbi:MAG: 1-(5-phosphoribosyl)-5-[(5-phosphoribosylamino)methylideneamino]imidazole-4-carboxamide isomerase [Chitinophagaceae bacterium]
MQIIPAIDIIDGKCVRLTQGDYSKKKIYNEDPLEVALAFEAGGISRLHLVDLDGARAGMVKNWKVLELITRKTSMIIDFGGGIKQEADLLRVFDSGAKYATIGSLAVKSKDLFSEWLVRYGSDRFLLGADVKQGKIAVSGWEETSSVELFDLLNDYHEQGVHQVFCTDVSKDGLLQGPAIELYQSIISKFPAIDLIASGGVRGVEDLLELEHIGCSAAIVGKAFYEGLISIAELQHFEARHTAKIQVTE